MTGNKETAKGTPEAKEASDIDNGTPTALKPVYVSEVMATAQRLAQLSALEYEQCRNIEAKTLGVRLPALDAAVKDERRKLSNSTTTNSTLVEEETAIWDGFVELSEILKEIVIALDKHTVLAPGSATAIALWIVHTYVFDEFNHSPRLLLSSPEKQCGKSTVMSIIKNMVNKPLIASNVTAPVIFRSIEHCQPTIMLDEADTFIDRSEDMRGIINSGHGKAAASVLRNVGDDHTPQPFSTWAPMVIGQIGFPPDTILDRSITIPMRRKKSSESCSPTPRDMKNFFAPLRMKLRRWASEHRDSIEFVNPSIPRSLRDRAADNWRPLLAIAETAGDDWPSRAAKAAETLSKLSRLNDESYGEMLLRDVGELFKTTGRDKLTTAEILLDLIGMDHRPWPEWKNGRPISDRQIALILQPFGISSKNIRLGAVQAKGYELSDFLDSFERYLS